MVLHHWSIQAKCDSFALYIYSKNNVGISVLFKQTCMHAYILFYSLFLVDNYESLKS